VTVAAVQSGSRRRVAVVGGGLGGMAAAGRLARAGCDVTLFEAAAVLGGKAGSLIADGVRLDLGPTLLAWPAVVCDTFAALGAHDLVPPLVALETHAEYRFADGARFAVHADGARTAAEVSAVSAADARALAGFYDEAAAIHRAAGEPYLDAPFEGVVDFMTRVARRGWPAVWTGLRLGTLADLAARHFRTPYLRQFVGRYATYAGASPYAASAAFALIPHLERVHGVHHVRGGVGALVDALAAALRRTGVTVETGRRVAWRRDGARFVVAGRVFDAVVVNADPLPVPVDGPLALSAYVLLLRVPGRVPLPHHTVLFSSDYPAEFRALFAGTPPADPTVYVCHPAATDPDMAPPDASGLFVMLNAPVLPGGGVPAERYRAACLARLEAVVPGIGRAADVLGERAPADFSRLGGPRGSLYGFLPHGRFGPFRRPRIRAGVPGVFHVGGGTHPGGGVPLVLLSARFAADMTRTYLEHR